MVAPLISCDLVQLLYGIPYLVLMNSSVIESRAKLGKNSCFLDFAWGRREGEGDGNFELPKLLASPVTLQ